MVDQILRKKALQKENLCLKFASFTISSYRDIQNNRKIPKLGSIH